LRRRQVPLPEDRNGRERGGGGEREHDRGRDAWGAQTRSALE
jgi:hypothetical protein